MRFGRNALGLLLTSTAKLPIALLNGVVLARFLSVDDRGLYSVATALAALVALFANMGWESASIYRLRRVGSQPAQVATAALLAVAGVSLPLILVCGLFEWWITPHLLRGAPPVVFYLALATVPMQLLALVFTAIARGLDRFALQNAYQFALAVATLAATAYALVVRDGALVQALIALLSARILLTLGLVGAMLRITGLSGRLRPGEIVDSLRFGLKTYAQVLAGQLHERIDIFMLAYLLADPGQVAFYAIAAGLVERLKVIPDAMGHAAYPQLAGLDRDRAARFAAALARQCVVGVLATCLIFGIGAPALIPLLYGAPYTASVLPFLVLLPGMGLLTLYRVLGRYFMAMDQQRTNLITQVLSVGVNIALNWWLIPRHGILGAAVASLVSYGLEAALITLVFRHTTGHGLREILVFGLADLEPYRRRLEPLVRRWVRAR